jgi:hypothetical protein
LSQVKNPSEDDLRNLEVRKEKILFSKVKGQEGSGSSMVAKQLLQKVILYEKMNSQLEFEKR